MSSKSPSLAELQLWFKEQIRPMEKSSRTSLKPTGIFNPQGGVPGEDRLAVYAGGYLARTHEALCEAYEAIHHILGKGPFLKVSKAYASRVPSQDYDLSGFGHAFSDYLRDAPIAERLPFLPDLARLEWKVAYAFHAYEQVPMDSILLQQQTDKDWDRLHFRFQPSVALVRSEWPILDVWEARHTPVEQIDLQVEGRPQQVLVYRSGFKVQCEAIEPAREQLLRALKAGKSLGEVCGLLAVTHGDKPLPLTDWFGHLVRNGLIIDCSFKN